MKRLFLTSEISEVAEDIADYINKPKSKKLAFIYTAHEYSKEESDWVKKDRSSLLKAGFNLFDYTITGKNKNDFDSDLGPADIIHINGGNGFYLLLQSKKTGFDKWIYEAVNNDEKIYMGSSAGSSIAGPNISVKAKKKSEEFMKELGDFNSYGLVDFVVMPHWGQLDFKDLYKNERFELSYNLKNKLIYLTDYQYVRVEGDMYRIEEVKRKLTLSQGATL
jgi:dipeptidase E